jgi:hypothetical protein
MKTHRKLFPELFHTVTPPDTAPDGEAGGGGGAPDATDPSSSGEGPTADDVRRLQEALKKERNLKEQVERRLKAIDPNQVEEARREAEEARQARELAEREASTRIAAIQQRAQKELQEAREEAAKAVEDARRLKVRVKWESEFVASGGFTEPSEIDGTTSFDLLWKHDGATFEEDEQGLYLKGADGLAVIDKETGKRVTPRQHFERLRNDRLYSAHFQPIGGSGGGSGAGVRGRVQHKQSLDGMSSRDLLRLGLEGK